MISLVLTAMVQNLWQFAAGVRRAGTAGLAGTGPVIASRVVARWFNRRRGTALSGARRRLDARDEPARASASPGSSSPGGSRIAYSGHRPRVLVAHRYPVPLGRPRLARIDRPHSGRRAAPRPGRDESGSRSATRGDPTLAFGQLATSFFTSRVLDEPLSAHGLSMLTDQGYTPMSRLVGPRRARRLPHRLHASCSARFPIASDAGPCSPPSSRRAS